MTAAQFRSPGAPPRPPIIRARTGARGCGCARTQYDIYMEMALQCYPEGSFMVDPPAPIDLAGLGIQALGVKDIVDERGVTHLIDVVGREHYREVTDYLTETRRMGVSRKLSSSFPLSRLTAESTLTLVHARARVANHRQFEHLPDFRCLCGQPHQAGDDCLGLAWHAADRDKAGQRQVPSGPYTLPSRGPEAVWEAAIFLRVPITHLVVVEGPNQQRLAERLKLARASGLPVVTSTQ